jgi:hypothetical protein
MRIARVKIGLFALFLAAPVIVVLIFGPTDSYGRPQTRFPAIGKVLLGKKGRFDQFGDAVLERSAVRRMAIQLRNWSSYHIVGFVDDEHVVSGNGGWLFYRAEFDGGRCLDQDLVAKRLRGLAVLTDMAEASGIDMFVSISPDKSTIYPEALSTMMRGYWKCRVENIAALRRIIKRELPLAIDHAGPLLDEKARNPGVRLYYATDTHWTPYGSAVALRQLVAAVYPHAQIPPPRLSEVQEKSTDLSRLLLLPTKEKANTVEPLRAEDLGSEIADPRAPRTLIVHDSFYGSLRKQLLGLFSQQTVLHSIANDDDLGVDTMAAARIIVNLVERDLEMWIEKKLNWDTSMPKAIVARNMRRAEDCDSFGAARGEDHVEPAGRFLDVAVRVVPAGRLPCIRLALSVAAPADLIVALPNAGGAFEPGHVVKHRLAVGQQTIAFVLPAYAAGAGVRVSLERTDDANGISDVAVGEIPASLPASSAASGADQP